VFNYLLCTTHLHVNQWLLAIAPAALLFVLWELGKLMVRSQGTNPQAKAAPQAAPVAA
jgi:hypothetical protein